MKFKTVKKVTAMVCAASMFAGCGVGKNDSDSGDGTTLKFSVYNMTYSDSPLGTQVQEKWEEMAEKYIGMDLDITWKELAINDYAQKMSVYLAGNKYDDVFMVTGLGTDAIDWVNNLGEEGKIVNIMDYKDELKYFPKYLEQNYGRQRVENAEGAIYCFPSSSYKNGTNVDSYGSIAMRFDILKKHNITPPTTLDEYYSVAKQLKELYPSSYPINALSSSMLLKAVCEINNTEPEIYYNGKEYVYGPLADKEAYKSSLQFLNKLYKEKLLDNEYIVQTDDMMMEKLLSGKSFIALPFSGTRIQNREMNNNPNSPGADWGIVDRPLNSKGEKPWSRVSKEGYELSIDTMMVISEKAKNKDKLVKLLDYMYSDEMIELAAWGIEGVTYEKNENGENSFVQSIAEADNCMTELAKYGVNSSLSVRSGIQCIPTKDPVFPEIPVSYWSAENGYETKDINHVEEFKDGDLRNPNLLPPPVKLTADMREERTMLLVPLETYVEENTTKFITGAKSFDEYDKFIDGISEICDMKKLLGMYNDNIVK